MYQLDCENVLLELPMEYNFMINCMHAVERHNNVIAIVHPLVFGLQGLSLLISSSSCFYSGAFNAKSAFPLYAFPL